MEKESSYYNRHAKLNHAITRCLRDTGDGDYIAARLAARHVLPHQFYWSAEQALEKYLKAILALNRIPAINIRHDIDLALNAISKELGIEIPLTPAQKEVFNQIAVWKDDRYFLGFIEVRGDELQYLDSMVWRIRQYCQPLDVRHHADTPSREVFLENVRVIEERLKGPAKGGHIPGGVLENILHDKKNPARPALVWKNFTYSTSNRKVIKRRNYGRMSNAPLWLNPELTEELAKLLFVPGDAKKAYMQLAEQRSKD